MIFINNKYTNIYFNIIKSAQIRDLLSGYSEKHHIIPKSLGGSNKKDNLVILTAREHFICHWLLTKMVLGQDKYKMWNAFSCMLYRETDSQQRYKISSKVFENIKKEGSKIKSNRFSGENNPMYGRRGKDHPSFGKTVSAETKIKQSIAHYGQTRSLESRQKQSAKTKGRKQSDIHIQNRSGINHPNYGKQLDPSIKEKIKNTILNKPQFTCEFCGKTTTKGNYKRWHSTNCKLFVI